MRHALGRLGLAAVLVITIVSSLSAAITYSPAQPNVDQTVAFTFSTTLPVGIASIQWNFGDGTGAIGQTTVNKVYKTSGTFQVDVTYSVIMNPTEFHETTFITVVERRKIVFAPSSPLINQSVMFQAQNFLSSSIRWNFGDGSPAVMAGSTITHAFAHPANFQVRAWDLGGTSQVAITVSVPVGADYSQRRIQASPDHPVAGRPVTLTAVNFFTSNIRWDFGDGASFVGGPSAVHTYNRSGVYLVQAWDWGGSFGDPTALALPVLEATGPQAAFQIFFLQLRFDDGKAYKVVPRDAAGLTAYADIKYEGTGIFRAQWLVDGAPFRTVTRAMPFAEAMTLDSTGVMPGQVPVLPGFPTNIPGVHEISLQLLSPAADFVVPVIRYFVSADASIPPQELTEVRLAVESVHGVEGVACRLTAGALEVPAGRYVILTGVLSYGLRRPPAKFVLFRVHLEKEPVDQQLLRDLKPGEERSFCTSIFNPSAEEKWVYITVYGLDGAKAQLLFFQKIRLYSRESGSGGNAPGASRLPGAVGF